MRDRGGQSKKPARGTLRDQYHLKNYGYRRNTSTLHPRKIADSILQSVIGQNVGQTTANFRHPIRRMEHKGSIMEVPFGPKFNLPGFMKNTVLVENEARDLGLKFARTHGRIPAGTKVNPLWNNFIDSSGADATGLGTPFEKRIGHLHAHAPLSPGHMVAGNDSFLSHLARLQDSAANREFLNWMMEHHFRRPN